MSLGEICKVKLVPTGFLCNCAFPLGAAAHELPWCELPMPHAQPLGEACAERCGALVQKVTALRSQAD